MEIVVWLIIFIMPVGLMFIVYNMFQQDLHHVKSIRKLKRGAIEGLIEKHRRYVYIHVLVLIAILVFTIILFGVAGLPIFIAWLISFMGHVSAFSNFGKQLITFFKKEDVDIDVNNLYRSRESDVDELNVDIDVNNLPIYLDEEMIENTLKNINKTDAPTG